jgi:tRNA(fMet)-specific endonuclease VapC
MIIADTDVLIDYLEGRDPGAEAVSLALERDQLHTTVISYFELLSGARRPHERDAISVLLESISVLSLDLSAARRAADIRLQLEGTELGIGMADSLIAGIALHCEAKLLSRNRRHFDRVPGLLLVAPGSEASRQSAESH